MSDRETGVGSGAGPVFVIGGREDKDGDRAVLKAVADALGGRKLVIATVASHSPDGYLDAYEQAFADLGVGELVELYVDDRAEANDDRKLQLLQDAGGVFFTGGDQLRISSQLAATPLEDRIRELWRSGGVLAGTSAGASVLSETMLVRGAGRTSYRIGDLDMAPGLGLLPGMIIDQHFAERGRIGRLIGAIAHSPRVLGVGIDEDTAIVVRGDRFEVLGSGAVYVVDGSGITRSNIAEGPRDGPLSVADVTLHVLAAGDTFDLRTRRPQ